MVVGLVTYEYKRYRFWAHWSRPTIAAALLSIAALNAGIGFLAALVAQGTDWFPAGDSAWLANGLIFAGLGEAVPRTLLRGSGTPGSQAQANSSPSTALGLVLGWLERALDTLAGDAVRRYVTRDLNDEERIEGASLIVYVEIQPDPDLDQSVKNELAANLDQVTAVLRGQAAGDAAVARGQLNGFLVKEFISRFLMRF